MWKPLTLVLCLLGGPLAAQSPVDSRGLNRAWLDLGQPMGATLSLKLDAAGVAILPSEDGHVRARYVGTGEHDLSRVRLRFAPSGNPAELRMDHNLHNDFRVEIQVPKTIALLLRMSAGEVSIQGIEGDKDLRLQAGVIKVHVGDSAGYGPVSAAVWAGEIRPGPFGETQEGLFRSFSYEGRGRYSLLAKVKAGEVAFEK